MTYTLQDLPFLMTKSELARIMGYSRTNYMIKVVFTDEFCKKVGYDLKRDKNEQRFTRQQTLAIYKELQMIK